MFKRLGHINDQLHEIELAKSKPEHGELILVSFFILQYAKLRMLDPCYKFFENFAITTNLTRWKWILFHYLAPADKNYMIYTK